MPRAPRASGAVVPDGDARALEASVHDPDRFTEIFDRYFSQVHSYVARRLGTGVADDLAAETLLIAFRQRAKFDSRQGIVRAWLYGIATNLIRRHRRDEVRPGGDRQAAAAELTGEHEERAAARVTAMAARRELAGALATLSAGRP